MNWPLSQDYNEAIQDPVNNLADAELRGGEAASNALGLPLPRSGNFADVYEFNCPATGSKWAVKCFTRQIQGQATRYQEISRALEQINIPFAVDFQYQVQGIRVRGQWYPILKMRWVEGQLLNEIVRDNLERPAVLKQLMHIWARMGKRLRETGIAHADLQHGNVLFVPGSQKTSLAVKLIDYDGMFVPALNGKKSGEVGHPNYQHPERLRTGTYSLEVDRFPLLVVGTALGALAEGGRALWDRYDNGDNLLFKESDLRAPEQSPLFHELRGLRDPQGQLLVQELQQSLRRRLEDVPPLDELLPDPQPVAVAVPAAPPPPVPVATVATAPPAASVWDIDPEEATRRTRRRLREGARIPTFVWVALSVVVTCAAVALLLVMLDDGRANGKQQLTTLPKGDSATKLAKDGTESKPKDKLDPVKPVIPDGWKDIDLTGRTLSASHVLELPPGHTLGTRGRYKGPVEVTVVVRMDQSSPRLVAMRDNQPLLYWRVNFKVDYTPSPLQDGSGGSSVFLPARYTRNVWYTLRWRVTENSLEVALPDNPKASDRCARKQDLSEEAGYQISPLVLPLEIQSFTVKEIKN